MSPPIGAKIKKHEEEESGSLHEENGTSAVDSENTETQGKTEISVTMSKPYEQDKVYRVFTWINHDWLKGALNRIALRAGAYIISYSETADVLDEGNLAEDLATIMGYIEAANFVILGIDENVPGTTICQECNNCSISSCPQRDKMCAFPIEVFIFRYAQEKGKWVLPYFILPPRATQSQPLFVDLKEEMRSLGGYRELPAGNLDIERIEDEYRTFVFSWKESHRGEMFVFSPIASSKDRLLRVMSECIQEESRPRTIGQYTIESGEMADADGGDEIHIITNELFNYDFTPMSSLTIAINTRKGVHYYYYISRDQIAAVEKFKERIAKYYRQSFKVKRGVISWIRREKSKLFNYDEFLNGIKNLSVRNIVERLLSDSGLPTDVEILDEMCQMICEAAQVKNRDQLIFQGINVPRIVGWAAGQTENNNRLRSTIYTDIDKICSLLAPFDGKYSEYRDAYTAVKAFCDKIELLKHMKMLTVWHAEDPDDEKVDVGRIKPSASDIEDILDRTFSTFQGSTGEIVIPGPMSEWLSPRNDNGELLMYNGEVPVSDSDVATWLSNIHCCPIDDERPYTLCYNFSLFLCHGGSDDADAAWYTTCEKNAQSKPNDEVVDNNLIMIGFDSKSSIYREIKECYKQIILSNPEAYNELKRSHSRLLEVMGIK